MEVAALRALAYLGFMRATGAARHGANSFEPPRRRLQPSDAMTLRQAPLPGARAATAAKEMA